MKKLTGKKQTVRKPHRKRAKPVKKELGPKIPKGWRALRTREKIRKEDKVWVWNSGPWESVSEWTIGETYRWTCSHNPMIRKLPTQPRPGRGVKGKGRA